MVVNGCRRRQEGDRGRRHRSRTSTFDVPIERSSWVALRIYPSSHTNPVFVLVDGKPIRASQKSAEWCLKSVDQCWSQKQSGPSGPTNAAAARQAYDEAREAYRKILAEAAQTIRTRLRRIR